MRSSPFIQLSLDFDCRQGGFTDSRGVKYICIGSCHNGAARRYISTDGFPWTLWLRTLRLERGYISAHNSPGVMIGRKKRVPYPMMKFRHRMCFVHRIVAQYFLNDGKPVPPGYEVDHLDGNHQNNAVDNLEIVTREENNRRRNERHHYKTMSAHKRAVANRARRRWHARKQAERRAAQQSKLKSKN